MAEEGFIPLARPTGEQTNLFEIPTATGARDEMLQRQTNWTPDYSYAEQGAAAAWRVLREIPELFATQAFYNYGYKLGSDNLQSPERLNQVFEGRIDKPFTESLPIEVAKSLVAREQSERELDYIIANGPGGQGFVMAASIGGAIVSALSPTEMAIGAGIGKAIRLARQFSAVNRMRKVNSVAKTLDRTGFLGFTVQNQLGALVSEAAIQFPLEDFYQNEIDKTERIMYSQAGSFLLGSLAYGLSGGYRNVKTNAESYKRTQNYYEENIGRAETDRPSGNNFTETVLSKKLLKVDTDNGFNFKSKDFSQRATDGDEFFFTSNRDGDMSDTRGYGPYNNAGFGVNLTDNPNIAKNIAGTEFATKPGKTYRAKLKNMDKFINLDETADSAFLKVTKRIVKEGKNNNPAFDYDQVNAEIFKPNATKKDIYDAIINFEDMGALDINTVSNLNQKLSLMGFRGLYNKTKDAGFKTGVQSDSDFNNVVAFYPGDVEVRGELGANRKTSAYGSEDIKEDIKQQRSEKTKYEPSDEDMRDFEENSQEPSEQVRPDYADEYVQREFSEEELADIQEEISRIKKKGKDVEQGIDDAFNCLRG